MNHNLVKIMKKMFAVTLTVALLMPGLPNVQASNSRPDREALVNQREQMQNSASSNTPEASARPTTSYDTAEEELPPGETPAKRPTAVTDREAFDAEEEVAVDTPEGDRPGTSATEPSGSSQDSQQSPSGSGNEGKKDFVDLNGDGVDDSSPDDADNRASNKQDEVTPEKPDGTIEIPNIKPSFPDQGTSVGGFQYQGNSQPGSNTSPSDRENISSAALDALYRTQIQALSDQLPEGTSLEVALKDAGPQYQKALQAAQILAGTENIKVFDINLKKEDGSNLHQLDDYVEVRMDIPKDYVIAEDNTVVVHYLSEEGETEPCATVYHREDPDNRYLTFRTDHFSVYFFMETSKEQASEIYKSAGLTASAEILTAGFTETAAEADAAPNWYVWAIVGFITVAGTITVVLVIKKKKQ